MSQQTKISRRAFLTGHRQPKTEIGPACLNNMGVYCQSCKDVCAEDAITFNQAYCGIQLLFIMPERCTSCKECIDSCPADAITIMDS